jgi:hypothetical protein
LKECGHFGFSMKRSEGDMVALRKDFGFIHPNR